MSICKHLIIDFAGGSGYKMKKDEGNVASFIADLNLLIDNNNYNKIHCDINRMGVWSVFTNYIKCYFYPQSLEFPCSSNCSFIDVFTLTYFNTMEVVDLVDKYFKPTILDYKIVERKKPDVYDEIPQLFYQRFVSIDEENNESEVDDNEYELKL